MSTIPQTLSTWLSEHISDERIVIAYSGGRDSHVLLHALWQYRLQFPALRLSAIHINHGLQQSSQDWVKHCQAICQSYDIPLDVITLSMQLIPGESVENLARLQRYAAISKGLQRNDILVTAHTMDDQAETFILQLLRGAGPVGLAGIAPTKNLGMGKLARPLLGIKREEITSYAQNHQLRWVEDLSNANLRFRRNFVRHQVFPLLHSVNPGFVQCIARSSAHCAHSQQLLNEYLNDELNKIMGEAENTLKLAAFSALSPLKQPHLLRHWLRHNGIKSPSQKKIQAILLQMLTAKRDAQPCVAWSDFQVRRYKDLLYVLPITSHEIATMTWELTKPLSLGNFIWQAKLQRGQGLSRDKVIEDALQIRSRQGGERCRREGSPFSKPLKKILQELKVPSWQRSSLPLFYQNEALVGVGELFICEGWQVKEPQEWGWVIERCR